MQTLMDKEYTWNELLAEGFEVDEYKFPDFEGTFQGVLESKCWGIRKLKGSLVASIALDDGRKIKVVGWKSHRYAWQGDGWIEYHGIRDVHIGARVEVVLTRAKKSKRVYLETITAID